MIYNPRDYWPKRAARQGASYVAYDGRQDIFEAQRKQVTPFLTQKVPRGGSLLDFGCGVGRYAAALASLADQYIGVDIVPEAIALAPQLNNAKYIELPADRLPFPSESFDTVVAITVLQHIVSERDFKTWTIELARVIRRGGLFVIMDHNPMLKPDSHMNPRGPYLIATALRAQPFTIARIDEMHWLGTAARC